MRRGGRGNGRADVGRLGGAPALGLQREPHGRGQRLHPTSTATSVRHDIDGGVRISDGAFIESKEVVAGYFLIEADDLDEALAVAEQIPVPNGGVEIRPIRSDPHA